ncbi:MAG: DNA repair protein RecO (recombination protein O) [Cyclobacteriaceae bacterium]|jgi:DNA repair protein RecO (recombination protein O)
MLKKTQGIVINYFKYHDSSIIVKIYTRDYGLISVIVNGIRSAKSKRSIGFFQPFSILDIVLYYKSDRAIQRLSEYQFAYHTHNISVDIYKTTIAIFLSEVLSKVLIGEENQQDNLYDFLVKSVIRLNIIKKDIENFHIEVLLQLCAYLGFGMETTADLLTSMEIEPLEHQKDVSNYLDCIFREDFESLNLYSGTIRSESIQLLLTYYKHHGINVGEVKSLKVLKQVFN